MEHCHVASIHRGGEKKKKKKIVIYLQCLWFSESGVLNWWRNLQETALNNVSQGHSLKGKREIDLKHFGSKGKSPSQGFWLWIRLLVCAWHLHESGTSISLSDRSIYEPDYTNWEVFTMALPLHKMGNNDIQTIILLTNVVLHILWEKFVTLSLW